MRRGLGRGRVLVLAARRLRAATTTPAPTRRPAPTASHERPALRRRDGPPTPEPSGGTADDPAVAEETTALLDWQPVRGPVDDTVTRQRPLDADAAPRTATAAVLDGPGAAARSGRRTGSAITDALHRRGLRRRRRPGRAAEQPNRATVIDLATGRDVHGRRQVRRTHHQRRHLGARRRAARCTPRSDRAAPTAWPSVDLATRTSTLGWCAPQRHGFNDARITPAGTPLLTFDDAGRPAAPSTERRRHGSTPFPGVAGVHGLGRRRHRGRRGLVGGPEGARIEEAHFYARRRRGLLRPRPRHGRQPDVVRRRGVLRPRPAARRRPGRADALVARRRPRASPTSRRQARVPHGPAAAARLTLTALAGGDEQVTVTAR